MTDLHWEPSLALGVEEIDEQHRTFLRMAVELHEGHAERVVVYRTARRLMEGFIRVPARVLRRE